MPRQPRHVRSDEFQYDRDGSLTQVFHLHTANFAESTAGWADDAVFLYRELLIRQWMQGPLALGEDPPAMLAEWYPRSCSDTDRMRFVWEHYLRRKFQRLGTEAGRWEGCWINPRVEQGYVVAMDIRTRRVRDGRKGADKRYGRSNVTAIRPRKG